MIFLNTISEYIINQDLSIHDFVQNGLGKILVGHK
jgi:hypothetical protein